MRTLQKVQARVHVSPMIMKVACFFVRSTFRVAHPNSSARRVISADAQDENAKALNLITFSYRSEVRQPNCAFKPSRRRFRSER